MKADRSHVRAEVEETSLAVESLLNGSSARIEAAAALKDIPEGTLAEDALAVGVARRGVCCMTSLETRDLTGVA